MATKKKYDYILLDWDGNIAKTLQIWLEGCREVLLKYGHDLSDKEIGASFGAFTDLAERLNIPDSHKLMQEADEISSRKLPEAELYPNAIEVLEHFRKLKKPMALITSSSHGHIEPILKKYNLLDFFEVIITGEDVINRKPHPEPILKAIEALGATKESSLMIGDSDKDIGAANNAKVDCILFYPKEHKKFYNYNYLKSMKPRYTVEDFTAIKQIIKN
jgi:HAD superfamily hydrolase (TIGR01549 family)